MRIELHTILLSLTEPRRYHPLREAIVGKCCQTTKSVSLQPFGTGRVCWLKIVLDKKLLRAADQAARRTKRNRSALVRDALREHLRRLTIRDLEERDRAGYSKQRLTRGEASRWEAEAVCPAE
jgi:Arc/MetJ-type ribon-helix-helix transcriptional regulator